MKRLHDNAVSGNAESALAVEVATFKGATGKIVKNLLLLSILVEIKGGKHRAKIERLRAMYAALPPNDGSATYKAAKEAYRNAKRPLTTFCISGTAADRTTPRIHTGLIQADIDGVGGRLAEVRAQLQSDPHVAFVFLSPSGDGLKAGFRVEPNWERQVESFQSVQRYLRRRYGIEIDASTKDKLRLCYVSYDPELFTNSRAVVLKEGVGAAPLSPSSESTTILNDYSTTSTTPTTSQPASFREKIEALRLRKEFQTSNAALFKLYDTLVERLHPPRAGNRNKTLVNAVTMLYRAVTPELVKLFMRNFYLFNFSYYNDPLKQHEYEVERHLAAVAASYPKSLSADERAFYDLYDECERSAFRILRDFALYTGKGSLAPPLFPCACWQLALRLGKHDEQASRLLERFQKDGVIVIETMGVQRASGVMSKATIYRWMLPTG